jgi:hypothetical protein
MKLPCLIKFSDKKIKGKVENLEDKEYKRECLNLIEFPCIKRWNIEMDIKSLVIDKRGEKIYGENEYRKFNL